MAVLLDLDDAGEMETPVGLRNGGSEHARELLKGRVQMLWG